MHFEYLANELILDLFEYLDTIDLLRAFFNLNTRFNKLLFAQFQKYKLDFRSVSKDTFENICQDYLPYITNQIISLHLSDNEETPNLPQIFLSRYFSIERFVHLQSLALYYIRSVKLLTQCTRLLPSLTHLKLIKCYFNYPESDLQCLMNHIWNLPRLTHGTFDQITLRKMRLTNISIVSSSIKSLSLEKVTCDFHDVSHLFEYTPCLQRISINLAYGFPNQQLERPILSMISLKILYHGSINMLTNLFQHLPNLISVTIETFDIYSNGYEWQQILTSSLVNVKIFHLKMNLNFPIMDNINAQVDQLLETFRTSFWLEQQQRFVRCDWDPSNIFRNGVLYTLPYAFDDCFYFDAVSSKSTCPIETDYRIYDRVQILSHDNPENDLSKQDILFSTRFNNIHHLKISLPFNGHFRSCISSLDRLKSINVTIMHTYSAYAQLQDLFNRAVHLRSLKISHSRDITMTLFTLRSPSIRRFIFLKKSKSSMRYFNSSECFSISRSPLLAHCEVLSIAIKSRFDIIALMDTITSLRSLSCHCQEDEHTAWCSSSGHDELIEWLRARSPSTHSISRDEKCTDLIRIWISRRSL